MVMEAGRECLINTFALAFIKDEDVAKISIVEVVVMMDEVKIEKEKLLEKLAMLKCK